MEDIKEFQGEYRWLSNFWRCDVFIDGIRYDSSEAAFQAFKTTDNIKRLEMSVMSPAASKRAGRNLELRTDWEEVKVSVMYRILMCKFTQNQDLLYRLLNTGNSHLEEGNTWGDKFWGVCDGEGLNMLGKLLMVLRTDLFKMQSFAGRVVSGGGLLIDLDEVK